CALTEIFSLALPDALPISLEGDGEPGHPAQLCLSLEGPPPGQPPAEFVERVVHGDVADLRPDGLEEPGHIRGVVRLVQVQVEGPDRKSTRLNSSHVKISYA